MTFEKYPLKTQLILALIFIPPNFLVAYLCNFVLKMPFFMDMIFVYAASFFGIPCGLITGAGYIVFDAIIRHYNCLHLLYGICCITGTLLTKLIVTRHKEFLWFRAVLLVFVSAVVISFEGSIIYALFFSETGSNENTTILFLTYTLIQQSVGLQFSAFLARLPVNLFDKAIAVFGGFEIFLILDKLVFHHRKHQ